MLWYSSVWVRTFYLNLFLDAEPEYSPTRPKYLPKEPKNGLKVRNDLKQEPSDSKFNSKKNMSILTRKCLETKEKMKRENERKELEKIQAKKTKS
jgi:hypothetical protein